MKETEWQRKRIKQLEFAIYLCHMDLTELRAGAWLDLKTDLVRFLIDGGLNLRGLEPDHFSNNMALEIQASFQRELSKLAFRKEYAKRSPQQLFVRTEGLNTKSFLVGSEPDGPFYVTSVVIGGLPEEMLQKLLEYLAWSGIRRDRLRICDRATCGRVFLSKRAPRPNVNLHCSLICARRDATDRSRAKQREQYRKKIAAKWPKAPVGKKKLNRRA